MAAFNIFIGYGGIEFPDLGTRFFAMGEVVDLIADEGFQPEQLKQSLDLNSAIAKSQIYAEDEDSNQIFSVSDWYTEYVSDSGNIPTDTGIIVTRGNVTKPSGTEEKITRVDYPNGDYKTFTYDNDFRIDTITEVYSGMSKTYQLTYNIDGQIESKIQT